MDVIIKLSRLALLCQISPAGNNIAIINIMD
jgi:hypothetical protein